MQTIPIAGDLPIHKLVVQNAHRRFHKAKHPAIKPRKDWHYKLFKNPPETLAAVIQGASKKASLNVTKMIVLGILGGLYIGFGGALAVAGAGGFDPAWAARFPAIPKLLSGFLFPVGLEMIVVVGAELFTSNIMFMTVGVLTGTTKWHRALVVLLFSLLTNYLGTVICAGLSIYFADLLKSEPYIGYITKFLDGKIKPSFGEIVLRAIPANMLVNVAILSATAAEDITGKVIGIYLPISLFAVVGFDHLIANEFYFHLGFFNAPHIPYSTWLWKQFLGSLLGNLIGGSLVGLLYWYCYLSDTIPKSARWLVNMDCCCPSKDIVDDEEANGGGHKANH